MEHKCGLFKHLLLKTVSRLKELKQNTPVSGNVCLVSERSAGHMKLAAERDTAMRYSALKLEKSVSSISLAQFILAGQLLAWPLLQVVLHQQPVEASSLKTNREKGRAQSGAQHEGKLGGEPALLRNIA